MQKANLDEKRMRVAMSQRICPDWRVPVFAELAQRKDIDLTVYFGKGLPTGASRNADVFAGFAYKKLFTIPIHFTYKGIERYRAFHPTLPFHIIIKKHRAIIVEPSTNIFNNLFIYPLSKLFRKKFIWYEAGAPEERSGFRKIIEPLVKKMIKGADACITCNSYADQTLIDLGVPSEKIFRAQNTLDTRTIESDIAKYKPLVNSLKTELGTEQTKFALFIGAIEERKRLENLIAAISIMRERDLDIKLIVVGDGPHAAVLQKKLLPHETQYIKFVGRHTKDAVLYILTSDVVVLPGQGGLSIVHAFACGRPCIATTEAVAGGTSVYDYIKDEQNGFVAEVNDIDSLVEKMMLVFAKQGMLARLSEGAWKSSHELTVKRMVDGIENAVLYSVGKHAK